MGPERRKPTTTGERSVGSPSELSTGEKIQMVLRRLRGENLEAVLHERQVREEDIDRWYDLFLEGGKSALRRLEPLHTKIAETEKLTEELKCLLETQRHTSRHEEAVQKFLERNPFFLPGLWDMHNGPTGPVVVIKPNMGVFIPDFAFVSQTTASYQFTLIEIEDPCKPIFAERDRFDSKFRDAQQQVKDWVGAFDRLKDRLLAIFSDVLPTYAEWKYKYCKAFLIYGRREEVEKSRKRRERWSAETKYTLPGREQVEIMTYDRLLTPLGVVLERGRNIERLRTCRYVDRRLQELD